MPAQRTTWSSSSCRPDGSRLAQEDPRRVDAREPQPVARALPGLDGHAALNGEHRREEQGDPEDARRGVAERRLVRADGEGQQDEHEDGEGDDLPEGDPGPGLNAEVLAGHQHRVMPHGWPPRRAPTRRAPPPAPR